MKMAKCQFFWKAAVMFLFVNKAAYAVFAIEAELCMLMILNGFDTIQSFCSTLNLNLNSPKTRNIQRLERMSAVWGKSH